MVVGLETFRKYFEGYYGDYVVIGGVACELALKSLGLDFRGTRDFDIVIVSETIARGFGIKLKQFIREGGYSVQPRKSNGKLTFFRFLNPKNDAFPSQLEFATEKPFDDWEGDFAPLDAGDAHSSLSAILFDPDFYHFILDNTSISNGISVIRLEGLIPLKCLAFLKLSRMDNPSPKITANIEKHRQDIFRLAEALPAGVFPLPEKVATATSEALNLIAERPADENEADVLIMLRQFYGLL